MKIWHLLPFSLAMTLAAEEGLCPSPPRCCSRPAVAPCADPRLVPGSIAHHAAFAYLYGDRTEGQAVLKELARLLQLPVQEGSLLCLVQASCPEIVAALSSQPLAEERLLSTSTCELIERAASGLANRKLRGSKIKTEEELLALDAEQVDIARGLMIVLGEETLSSSYEQLVDLLALQVMARLPVQATYHDKIDAINGLLFGQLGIRFPPKMSYGRQIKRYTSPTEVLSSRRGICLGVCLLYGAIAQRIDLPFEIVTPPGHIFLACGSRNIETTAAGAHLDECHYRDLEERPLPKRSAKEVMGLALFNEAADELQEGRLEQALFLYRKSQPYLNNEPSSCLIHGLAALAAGSEEEGVERLKLVLLQADKATTHMLIVAEDLLEKRCDPRFALRLLCHKEEGSELLVQLKLLLEEFATQSSYRGGYPLLAQLCLQAHQRDKAFELLLRYDELFNGDLAAELLLVQIAADRYKLATAWHHLHKSEALSLKRHQRLLRSVQEVRLALTALSRE